MLATLFAAPCLVVALLGGEDAPILWGERRVAFEALPAELPPAARSALEAWYAWAGANAYRLDLDPAGRVLLLSRRSNDRAPRQLELAVQVVARFDQELPAPSVRRVVADPLVSAKAPPEPVREKPPLPEDPEDPEGGHPWTLEPPKPVQVSAAPVVVTKWGSQGAPLDTQTVVLFILEDQYDFDTLLKHLAGQFAWLERWSHEAGALQGFVLGDPLTGAYLERPDGVEEWDPDHEVVNRMARLCLLRRFGDLPNWFVQGYAWHMEFALQGSVYCFPWRDEFVWATEHSGWDKIVQARYAKAKVQPADFLGWKRGKYVDAQAKAAWVMSEYLVRKEAARLPDLLEHLRAHREEHGRVQEDASSWRRDTDYEIPLGEQHKLLVEHLGARYLESAALWIRAEL